MARLKEMRGTEMGMRGEETRGDERKRWEMRRELALYEEMRTASTRR